MLDPDRKSPRAKEFEDKLSGLIVGQERAVRRMSGLFQIYLAGMNNPSRPIGTMLFLGPTGSGKTRVVEAAAEVLFGEPHAVVKIDCAEFQHSHEIAKLIGSPPGYLGHRETSPMLTQENLDKSHTDDTKLTFVLFDEIEKASDSLWQLLLGILDKATLTLGDNRRVDFSKTVVIMTSNLGAREMSDMISGGIGFAPTQDDQAKADNEIDTKIYRTALEAAKRKFSPEFMNRIDKVVVFRSLKEHHLRPNPRHRTSGRAGPHHGIGGDEIRLRMHGRGEGIFARRRHRSQVRRTPPEAFDRAVSWSIRFRISSPPSRSRPATS